MNLVGSRLGPYEIIEEIGRGGMATVYRAYQPNVDRFVAIKVMHRAIAADAAALERFQREARIIARLEHPNLLPIYDYDGKNDPPYIVMRYLEGTTLRDALDVDVIPLDDVVHVVRQVSAALDYAHQQGVIHRDIKPSNVMIDTRGNAFLMDFGIARLGESTGEVTQAGFAVGTPTYMSPEQGMGLKTVDARSDVYALGVLIFQALTGEVPFKDDSTLSIILKHINQPPPMPSTLNAELPAEIDDVLMKALAKKPEDRYQTAGELAADLARAAHLGSNAQPSFVKQTAQDAYKTLLADRASRQAELDETMAEFEASRGSADSTPVVSMDGPTTSVPLPPQTPRPSRPWWAWAGGLAALIVIVFFAAQAIGPSPLATPTPTSTTQAAVAATGTTGSSLLPSPTPSRTTPPSPTALPSATMTSTVTASATASPSATASATATPATPSAIVRRALTVRGGPGTSYPALMTVDGGTRLEILGISDDGSWYQVALPDGRVGWLATSVSLVETEGNVLSVPIAQAPTETPTVTLTASNTPSSTPSATATVPHSATPTASSTFTPPPSNTPTATDTATSLPTATATATATTTPSATPFPTPTPQPPGTLPFISDFEGLNPLDNWDYDPTRWQVIDDDGDYVLLGQATLRQPLVILGQTAPQWLNSGDADLVISMRFNLGEGSGGARILFNYSPAGYNVLDLLEGYLSVRRSSANPDFTQRDREVLVSQASVPIAANRWHDVMLWLDGDQVHVYVDRQRYLTAAMPDQARQGAGAILLQTNSDIHPVRFDDITIETAEAGSTGFAAAALPETWSVENGDARLAQEPGGNQYLYFQGPTSARPNTRPIRDIRLVCRINALQGDHTLYLRESEAGSTRLAFSAGNLTITLLNANGESVDERQVANVYNRGRWENWDISFVGSRLIIYRDGVVRFEDEMEGSLPAGTMRFAAPATPSLFGVDDCLFTETALPRNAATRELLRLRRATTERQASPLLSDFNETFDDPSFTAGWWYGGQNADGSFITDETAAANRQFLRMSYAARPTWRLFREDIGRGVFGAGSDTQTYRDSSDLDVTVLVRIPDTAGTAWVAARAEQTLSGANITGCYMELTRAPDSLLSLRARIVVNGQERIVYAGALPPGTPYQAGDWVPLEILTYQDQVGFFIDGRFLGAANRLSDLSGTVALGVEPGTTADFDALVIRDVTPG